MTIYDLITPATKTDTAVIIGLTNTFEGRGGRAYRVQATGKFAYNERVSRSFYTILHKGDTLQISLSRFFSEWKNVSVVRDGAIIVTHHPAGLFYMWLMAGWYILSVMAFLPHRTLLSARVWIFVAVAEFVALAMWYRLIGGRTRDGPSMPVSDDARCLGRPVQRSTSAPVERKRGQKMPCYSEAASSALKYT
jgi:hypothetical protein